MMPKLILNYTSLHEHTHLSTYTYLYIEDVHTKKVNEYAVTSERVNSNVMPTLHGLHWYPYFVA